MMRSLYSGVSGLKNHQTRMDVIGNNISNVNTTGFKSSRVTFTDMLSQTTRGASVPRDRIGGTNPKQIGLGSSVGSIDLIFQDGSVQSTGKNTDLCLSGNGLFVTKRDNVMYYTRNGAFEFDANGNYVLPGSGLYVQGWTENNGVIDTTTQVGNINVQAGKSMPAKVTSMVTYANNLNADIPMVTGLSGGVDPANIITKSATNAANPFTIIAGDSTNNYNLHVIGTDTDFDITKSWTLDKVDQTVTPNTARIRDAKGNVVNLTCDKITTTGTPTTPAVIPADGISKTTITPSDVSQSKVMSLNLSVMRIPFTIDVGEKTLNVTLNDPTAVTDIDLTQDWTIKEDAVIGADTITITAGGTDIVLKLDTGLDTPLTAGQAVGNITAKTYEVVGIDGNIDTTKEWTISAENNKTDALVATDASTTPPTVVNLKLKEEITLMTTDSTKLNVDPATGEVKPLTGDDFETTPPAGMIRKATSTDPLRVILSDGTIMVQTSGTYQVGNSMPVTTTITVYDSLGSAHEVPVYFTREGECEYNEDGSVKNVTSIDKWLVSLEPDASVTKGQATSYEYIEDNGTMTSVDLNTAEIQFTSSGRMVTNPTADPLKSDEDKNTMLTFTGGSIGTEGTEPGIPTEQTVAIDFSALTQFAGNNTVNATSDGNAAGVLKEIQLDNFGIITGIYTNGVRQQEAQVAVAQFANATGLNKVGDSLYQESNNSGTANIKSAGDLGVTITPSALEMSNVDVANEFADMIITQRGFQSNSKIVTVGDEMLETVINMKR